MVIFHATNSSVLSHSPQSPGSKCALAEVSKAFSLLFAYSDLSLKSLFGNLKYVKCISHGAVLCAGGIMMSAIFLTGPFDPSYCGFIADCNSHQLCFLLSQPKVPQGFTCTLVHFTEYLISPEIREGLTSLEISSVVSRCPDFAFAA